MKLLLVEDNKRLREVTTEGLKMLGFVVDETDTAEQALYLTEVEAYDVIILDRMLPGDKDGLEVCKTMRERGVTTPIIMLTALGEVSQRVAGLEGGADDYLVKPFALKELAARIQVLSRRAALEPSNTVMEIGPLTVNLAKKQVKKDGKEVYLSKRLWSLFEYFTLHRGQTISKAQLIDRVWGVESGIMENAVEVSVKHLRTKLGDTDSTIIQTVHGFGYKLVP